MLQEQDSFPGIGSDVLHGDFALAILAGMGTMISEHVRTELLNEIQTKSLLECCCCFSCSHALQ